MRTPRVPERRELVLLREPNEESGEVLVVMLRLLDVEVRLLLFEQVGRG